MPAALGRHCSAHPVLQRHGGHVADLWGRKHGFVAIGQPTDAQSGDSAAGEGRGVGRFCG